MRLNVVVSGVVVLCLAAVVSPVAAQGTEGSAGRSVLDGVYTQSQARHGRATFASVCADCHSSGQFRGRSFQSAWAGRTVQSLFGLVRSTMPDQDPGSLARDEYAAVVAYFLELNEYPKGSEPLPDDDEGLRRIRFEAKPDSAGS